MRGDAPLHPPRMGGGLRTPALWLRLGPAAPSPRDGGATGTAGPGWAVGAAAGSAGRRRPGLGGAGSAGRVTVSSRPAAAVRCSSCGRDTSRARMAVDSVILVTGISTSVA